MIVSVCVSVCVCVCQFEHIPGIESLFYQGFLSNLFLSTFTEPNLFCVGIKTFRGREADSEGGGLVRGEGGGGGGRRLKARNRVGKREKKRINDIHCSFLLLSVLSNANH